MSCSQSCRSSTVSVEMISPATNISLKSWRVKALAWSLTQVGLLNTLTTHTYIQFNKQYIDILLIRHQLWISVFTGIGSEEVQPFSMSLEAEMMLEQLKEQHLQEMEDLRNQLESKVSPIDPLYFIGLHIHVWIIVIKNGSKEACGDVYFWILMCIILNLSDNLRFIK